MTKPQSSPPTEGPEPDTSSGEETTSTSEAGADDGAESPKSDPSDAKPAAESRRSGRGPRAPKSGTYVLEKGDSPATVAVKLYGKGSMAVELVRANDGVKWKPGVEIQVP